MLKNQKTKINPEDIEKLKNEIERDQAEYDNKNKEILKTHREKTAALRSKRNQALRKNNKKEEKPEIHPEDEKLINTADNLIEKIKAENNERRAKYSNSVQNSEKIEDLFQKAAAPSESDKDKVDEIMKELQEEVNSKKQNQKLNQINPKEDSIKLQNVLLEKQAEIDSELSKINELLNIALDNNAKEDEIKQLLERSDKLSDELQSIKEQQSSLSQQTKYDPLKKEEELITKVMNPQNPSHCLSDLVTKARIR